MRPPPRRGLSRRHGLAVLAIRVLPGLPVVIAANRDEYHARPHCRGGPPGRTTLNIIAGRDLQSGGSWMGMTRDGRYALVTNYRDPMSIRPHARLRAASWWKTSCAGDAAPADYAAARGAKRGLTYNGFDLIVGDRDATLVLQQSRRIAASAGGRASTPCPTICWIRPGPSWRAPRRPSPTFCGAAPTPDVEALFEALGTAPSPWMPSYPDTGIGLERERFLSSAFIVGLTYGTRSSTADAAWANAIAALYERRLHAGRRRPPGVPTGTCVIALTRPNFNAWAPASKPVLRTRVCGFARYPLLSCARAAISA